MKTTSLFTPLLAALGVSAHGWLVQITIDGNVFKGNAPNRPQNPSIIRQIDDTGPVKGASNPDLNCGLNATVASDVADANPGSTVIFDWKGTDGVSNWPHNTGPMFTYMASCGSTTCDKFDPQTAKWFKTQQIARKDDGTWAQADISQGGTTSVTIPSTLAPGNYMIRHEILSLQNAVAKGGAEFYPACAQLRIGGNQKGGPTSDELVSLPGAYSDDDPGIFDPDVYNNQASYTFPGPKIAAFVSGGSGSGSGSGSGATTAATPSGGSSTAGSSTSNGGGNNSGSTPTPMSAPAPQPTPSTSCQLKKTAVSFNTKRAASTIHPRHVSRIMRGLVVGHSGFR